MEGNLAQHRRKETGGQALVAGRAVDATWKRKGKILMKDLRTGVGWGDCWVQRRRAGVQHAGRLGERAVAWAVLRSGLKYSPLLQKGFLLFVGKHLLLHVRLVSLAILWSGYKVASKMSEGAWGCNSE